MPSGTELLAYADDLALVVTAPNEENLTSTAQQAIAEIEYWITSNRLQLAAKETEIVVAAEYRRLRNIVLIMDNLKSTSKERGVWLIHNLRFAEHIS